MSYTIAINLPNLPVGGTLIIDGLGEFTNGASFDISDDDALMFQARKAEVVSDYDDKGQLHTSVETGPTLAEVYANHPYITVTTTPVVPPKVVTPVVPTVLVTPPVVTDPGKE